MFKAIHRICIVALLGLLAPPPVFGQALPWQTGGQQPSASQNTQPYQHRHQATSQNPAPQAPTANNSREQDDRRLNELATQFYAIKGTDAQAIPKLKKLLKEVKSYRTSLGHSGDKDIIKDAKNLDRRITKQLNGLEAKAKAAAPAKL